MTYSPSDLRSFIRDRMEKRDLNPCSLARLAGVHRNTAYSALNAEGDTRVGSLVRLIEDGLGYDVETVYKITGFSIPERRRLHDNA